MSAFEMYPTIITPFFDDGRIDKETLGKLIGLYAEIGCEGIFAVCQSSEMFFLNDEEKLDLAATSIDFCRKYGIKCVVSGHTQDALDDQIKYLKQLEKLNPDAIILVSNRLAAQNEDDLVALKALDSILASLGKDTKLGIYECPYPYKRPLTKPLLDAMVKDGRFRFVKDTCCMIDTIRERLAIIKGTDIALFNANMATFHESMESGCAGYSGIMLNVVPDVFKLLHKAYKADDKLLVKRINTYLSCISMIEYQNYPRNAKYLLTKRGILHGTQTRNGSKPLTESQMKELDSFQVCNALMLASLS